MQAPHPPSACASGEGGRADAAIDPALIEMFEFTVTFKPRAPWRPGMTLAKLRDELGAVRPKAMPVAMILAALFQLFIGTGGGSQVMQRIAAP